MKLVMARVTYPQPRSFHRVTTDCWGSKAYWCVAGENSVPLSILRCEGVSRPVQMFGRETAARESWPELWARLDHVLAMLESVPPH